MPHLKFNIFCYPVRYCMSFFKTCAIKSCKLIKNFSSYRMFDVTMESWINTDIGVNATKAGLVLLLITSTSIQTYRYTTCVQCGQAN